MFRGVAARCNYLSLDRLDLQYAAKEICRYMSSPCVRSWGKLKRLARYLVDQPAVVWRYSGRPSERQLILDIYSDSDWAGCSWSWRSTSGGIACLEGRTLKHWSSTQATVALSSGEAELHAFVKAAAEGLGIQSLAKGLGLETQIRIWVDSTSAKSTASRTGLGRVRHLETRFLWVQEALKKGRFKILKIAGTENPSDILTKPLSAKDMEKSLEKVGAKFEYRKKAVSWCDILDDDESGPWGV